MPGATTARRRLFLVLLENVPFLFLAAVVVGFGPAAPAFLSGDNLLNIVRHASAKAIVATGMTFVLIAAGIDLSVGSIMFLTAGVLAKMVLAGAPVPLALLAVLALGLACGAVNACLIVGFRVMPFIVTLATLYLGRGLGLWLTETRAMNLPESLTWIGSANIIGVPIPVAVLACVLVAAHVTLVHTPFGRQLHATGHDPAAARKAGDPDSRILVAVYLVSGACAAIGSVVSLTQLGSVSPTFGQRYEFLAIATAVLGGTSLFGGRGNVFPGTVLGALLVQSVESGLVIVKANVYIYPLVIAAIIFLAVLIDGLRQAQILKLGRRKIRAEESA